MKNKSGKKEITLKIDKENPYQSIHNRLKRMTKSEKEVFIDLYFAVKDAIRFRNDTVEAISQIEEFSVDEKNKKINEELEIIKSYDIYEDMFELVIGGKYFEKIGLWEKIKD